MKVNVLLRWNSDAIHGGRSESPVANHGQYLVFNPIAERLQNLRRGYYAAFIDGHFDDDISGHAARNLGAGDDWIRKNDREGWANLMSRKWTRKQRTRR